MQKSFSFLRAICDYTHIEKQSVSTTLGGNPAYRLDYMEKFLDFKKVIEVDTIKDGKLYKLWFVGDSDTMNNPEVVQKMIDSKDWLVLAKVLQPKRQSMSG